MQFSIPQRHTGARTIAGEDQMVSDDVVIFSAKSAPTGVELPAAGNRRSAFGICGTTTPPGEAPIQHVYGIDVQNPLYGPVIRAVNERGELAARQDAAGNIYAEIDGAEVLVGRALDYNGREFNAGGVTESADGPRRYKFVGFTLTLERDGRLQATPMLSNVVTAIVTADRMDEAAREAELAKAMGFLLQRFSQHLAYNADAVCVADMLLPLTPDGAVTVAAIARGLGYEPDLASIAGGGPAVVAQANAQDEATDAQDDAEDDAQAQDEAQDETSGEATDEATAETSGEATSEAAGDDAPAQAITPAQAIDADLEGLS